MVMDLFSIVAANLSAPGALQRERVRADGPKREPSEPMWAAPMQPKLDQHRRDEGQHEHQRDELDQPGSRVRVHPHFVHRRAARPRSTLAHRRYAYYIHHIAFIFLTYCNQSTSTLNTQFCAVTFSRNPRLTDRRIRNQYASLDSGVA